MDFFQKGRDIVLKQEDFDLNETLDCGQAFRWEKITDGYCGLFLDKPLTLTRKKDSFLFHDTIEADFLQYWVPYFDLDTNYGELKKMYAQDETLFRACAYAGGIRLLRQDPWEALCSFIVSQNNNIPRIKGIIARMCTMFNGFPRPEALAACGIEDLAGLRAGFRAKYILDAARKVSSGEVPLAELVHAPLDETRQGLQRIQGVGPKVAECAALYGMYRIEAFPVDVWIRRVMETYYPNGLPEYILPTAGIAQQYLFHYIRNLKKDTAELLQNAV